jgi:subtilisin family serine protease
MKLAVFAVLALALCHVQAAPTVSPSLYKTLSLQGQADIMVVMRDPVAPLVASVNRRHFATSSARTTQLVNELRQFTQAAQQPVLSFLAQRTNAHQVKPFWITNRISVKQASLTLIDDLRRNFKDQIAEIREARVIYLEDAQPVASPGPNALEWGVDIIDADLAWEQGITGEGVVVAGIDTGVRASHVALKDNIRESYNWFDASSVQSQTPADDAGHGTHIMGTIAGRDGTGVAPDSRWMHCRAFEGSSATEEALIICGQWVTCPTLPDGREEDCDKKPAVVSNSWGGGNEDPFFNDIINAWQAANIVPVFAIGNSGPLCRTANSPGDQPNVISVGATNAQNLITSFSSHGPSQTALRIKPEVSAPGNNVRSSSNLCDQCYVVMSGTSMACPHVAGSVALLRQKNPNATFEQISQALFSTTYRPQMGDIACPGGGVNATNPWPNNSHGWGNVRVNNALGSV